MARGFCCAFVWLSFLFCFAVWSVSFSLRTLLPVSRIRSAASSCSLYFCALVLVLPPVSVRLLSFADVFLFAACSSSLPGCTACSSATICSSCDLSSELFFERDGSSMYPELRLLLLRGSHLGAVCCELTH